LLEFGEIAFRFAAQPLIASRENAWHYDGTASGAYQDRETNLAYNWMRDYDSAIGRYVESDPVGLNAGLNTYLYVNGNPLSLIDSTGKFSYNTNDPDITAPLPLDMEWKVTCLESYLNMNLVITGGSEQTNPQGKPAHKCKNSAHYSGDAVDFSFKRNPGLPARTKEFLCYAVRCGFEYGQIESNPSHFHLQTIPGCGVPKLPSCPACP